ALERTGGFLILDEAHAVGVFREEGLGFSQGWTNWDRMLVTLTFGKAFGVSGAATLCSKTVRDWLVNVGRSFIFTTASPPAVCQQVELAMDLMQTEGSARRSELWERSVWVRDYLESKGVLCPAVYADEWGHRVPIISVPLAGNVQ